MLPCRRHWRRTLFALTTVLGGKPRGYFIPYSNAHRGRGIGQNRTYTALEPVFAAGVPYFQALQAEIDRFAPDLLAINETAPAPKPRWRQDWFPRLDAAAAYAMVRSRNPRLIIEVGSGHSTRFLTRAVADGGMQTEVVAIDPRPRAALKGLTVTHVEQMLQETDPAIFSRLATGDILFIDSSHVLMPGTDVDVLINHVLPTLPAGVLVHFHDIFLPDDYPPAWEWRGYNEQLAVAALLTGEAWRLLWSSHWMMRSSGRVPVHSVINRLPLVDGAIESSLWLEKGLSRNMQEIPAASA